MYKYSLEDVKYALMILQIEPDGSQANQAARQKAVDLLKQVAKDFRILAAQSPDSRPAKFLRETSRLYRQIAFENQG